MLERCAGLVCAFLFWEAAAVHVTDETIAHHLDDPHDWVWLHFGLADHRARRFLEGFAAAPPEARALMLGTEDRIQLRLSTDGAWGILPDIERDFADQSLGSGRFAFWMDDRHLVTARRHPLRGMERVRDAVEKGLVPASPAHLLARLQEEFVQIVETRLASLARDLGHIEDEVLADRVSDHRALGPLRRELSRYSREFSGLRSAIHRATGGRHGVAASPLLEHLPQMLQDAEDFDRDAGALSDRARLLYEEIETRIAAITNRSLSALTIISTLLLPPTFVAGAFGMNVGGIPWAQDREGFWAVLGFCVILIAVSYAVLRRFRILP
ncbi:MAG TPA: CorA family divalent cation transporter [Rhizomicrobium sp.]|nr:CorA family divalent cation transporter [Rhizomicrobium sp.]